MSREKTTEKTTENFDFETFAKHMQANARRINKININWTEDHTKELRRLCDVWGDRLKTAATATQESQARFFPLWQSEDLITDFLASIKVFAAFKEEWAHVLTDSGAQMSLFPEKKPTQKQREAWANYYEMDADLRRLWLLIAGNLLSGAQKYLQDIAAGNNAGQAIDDKKDKNFAAMFNMPALNDFAGITQRTPVEIDRASGKKIIKRGKTGKETKIEFDLNETPDELAKIDIGAKKLLDYSAHKLTQNNKHRRLAEQTEKDKAEFNAFMPQLEIRIPEKEYATATGIKPTQDNLRQCRKDWKRQLLQLQATKITGNWSGGTFVSCSIFGDVAIKNGYIYISYGLNFARYLIGSFVSYMPRAIFALDNKKPILYHLARKLTTHYGIDNNRIRGTYNLISVRALLDSCDEIPSEEEVRKSKTNRSLTLRRLKPLERALDELETCGIIKWEFANAKGEPLRENQLNQEYKDVIDAYIKFDVVGYPDPTPRLQARAKEKADKEKKRQRAIAKNMAKKQKKQATVGI